MMAMNSTLRGGQKPRILIAAVALLILGGGLSACDDAPKTAEDFLTRAEQAREKGNLRASNIELKNALQSNPQNARARRFMGLNYMDMGAWRNAETTLRRAGNDGADTLLLMRPMARVKLALGKPDEALKLIHLGNDMQPGLKADLLVLRGRALVNQRKPEDGRKAFEDAIKQDKNSFGGYIGLAGLALAEKKNDQADGLFAKAVAIAPDNADVLMFQGAYARFKKDYKGSEAAYQKLVKRRPSRIDYRIGLAGAQLALNNHKDAIKTLTPLLKAVPRHPGANYFRALAAYQAKDYETATAHTEKVLQVNRNNLPAILIAGGARFALKQYEQAANDLERFVARVPGHGPALRLLGAAQLQLRKPKEALKTLKPLAEKDDADASLLTLIGVAAIEARELEEGSEYFDRVVRLEPENAEARVHLGGIQIALGDIEQGLGELTKAVELDPKNQRADIALIINQIQAKRFEEALAAALKLQEKLPNDAIGYSLAGRAKMELKDSGGAKAYFEKALIIEPGRSDASNYLAWMAVKNKNIKQAASYLRDVLNLKPNHAQSLLRLAQLEAQLGHPDKTEKLMARAMEAYPDALPIRLLLGRFQLRMGSPEKSLATLEPALQKFSSNSALLEVTGRAYLKIQKYSDAAAMFRLLVEQRPKSAEAHFLLAQSYAGTKEYGALKKSLEAALEVDSNHQKARFTLVKLLIESRQFDEATKYLAVLRSSMPQSPSFNVLDGDLNFAQGKMAEAENAYQIASKQIKTAHLTLKLAQARWNSGNESESVSGLKDWLRTRPDDNGLRIRLASYYRKQNRLQDAEREYRIVIQKMPNSWIAYNELAWILFKSGDFEESFQLAKQAQKLSPENPMVMDTLALIYLARGDVAQSVGLLRKAARQLSRNPTVLFHLAQALNKEGKRGESLSILKESLADKRRFLERKEAEALLQELGG